MSHENPCLKCGACCAFFRVSFYWGETDLDPEGSVPHEFTEKLTGFRQCMKGTNQKKPYCAALEGKIGESVRCAIYANRPSPCREFGVVMENGAVRLNAENLKRCNRARATWGLAPLSHHAFRNTTQRLPTRFLFSVHAPHTCRIAGRLIHSVRDPRSGSLYMLSAPDRAGQRLIQRALF